MEIQQKVVHLTGREGEEFDPEVAASWTQNYRHKHPGETISHFFGKDILKKILAQEGCQGIRFYHAHSKPLNGWQRSMVSLSNFLLKVVGNIEGDKHLIVVGAAADGKDQLNEPAQPLSITETDSTTIQKRYLVGDQSLPCPGNPGCPKGAIAAN